MCVMYVGLVGWLDDVYKLDAYEHENHGKEDAGA